MSYLALARKWRPKYFSDVAGQDHVVRALLNGLQSGRVHHALLFAGTRGVGKTTLARILSKALNCETGETGEPCGKCGACLSIDEGRFVDLLEVDAASRTKVDQTRELLENVQYTPTSGRYKIYLIDEVHMLSASSFNALLKTLEEPPPHVKFLLATTNPDKLPVTVLSRCLQFNLKRLPAALIQERMSHICEQEGITVEAAALGRIARAARGSMRDGLSLLDQALVFGDGALQDVTVAEMLGSLDARHLREIAKALIAADAKGLMAQISQLHEQVPDYGAVLNDFATLLQQMAVAQLAGTAALDEDADAALVEELAGQIDPELVQLLYQLAITGRRDMALAPDPRIGFEMTLLRMLAFQPAGSASGGAGPVGGHGGAESASTPRASGKPAARAPASASAPVHTAQSWDAIVAGLDIGGAALQLARNCVIGARSATALQLDVGKSGQYLMSEGQQAQLAAALQASLGADLQVSFVPVQTEPDSPAQREKQQVRKHQTDAEKSIEEDPVVQGIIDVFGARIVAGSVKPVHPQTRH